jgi:hypothetical protein
MARVGVFGSQGARESGVEGSGCGRVPGMMEDATRLGTAAKDDMAEGKLSVFVSFAFACLFAEGLAWPGRGGRFFPSVSNLLCPAEACIKFAPL